MKNIEEIRQAFECVQHMKAHENRIEVAMVGQKACVSAGGIPVAVQSLQCALNDALKVVLVRRPLWAKPSAPYPQSHSPRLKEDNALIGYIGGRAICMGADG